MGHRSLLMPTEVPSCVAIRQADTPAIRALTCTYRPTVRGVGRVTFSARRV